MGRRRVLRVNSWPLAATPLVARVAGAAGGGLFSLLQSVCRWCVRARLPLMRSIPLLLGLSGLPMVGQAAENKELFNFVRPLDAVQVSGDNAYLPSVTAESAAQGEILRRATFNPGARPTLSLSPQQGNWDWSQSHAMSLRVQNAMDWALTLDVTLDSAEGKRLSTRIALPAGPAQTLLIPLGATSPRAQGMRAGLVMPWYHHGRRLLLAETVTGEIDKARVKSVSISIPAPHAVQHLLLGRFAVSDGAELGGAYHKIVDGYGQFSRSDWPGKIKSAAQLPQQIANEQRQLQAWLAERPAQDSFGGWVGGAAFTASGFFRTEKRAGRWFLITPQGNPFYSLGVNTVTASQSQTYVEGRETMFAALPAADEPLAAFYGRGEDQADTGANRGRAFSSGRWYDFYRANLERSYGQQPPQVWRQQAQDRLQAWGFNTLGNWSDADFAQDRRMPYSIPLSIHGDYATISTGVDWWGGMPDPFDPRFAMAAERAIAIATRDHREDPWVIGYYADNELAWAGPAQDPQSRYALAYATLRLTTDVPAKRAFLKQLRDKYRNQAGLSSAWGIALPAWELMEDPGFTAPPINPQFPAIESDMRQFLRLFADTYFKTIALREHSRSCAGLRALLRCPELQFLYPRASAGVRFRRIAQAGQAVAGDRVPFRLTRSWPLLGGRRRGVQRGTAWSGLCAFSGPGDGRAADSRGALVPVSGSAGHRAAA
jgi:hypothetical protein